ncbi:DUF898 family protein [Cardinium endosymbiont of Culicoides punctatus]|uniref:DUF898 family protein n=1 Tax=Cardinium endosymbiont of Culicoides punctatus TaxID=2304601 RepID=UPI0014054EF9|nr:DUF898 family protein [Cardinium endosymbiont of Culicoides punctatus]
MNQEEDINKLEYEGKLGKIFKLGLINLFFHIITLGIHSCWGSAKMRRYVIGKFKLGSYNLKYTGTGGELFKGFLLTLLLTFLLFFCYQLLFVGFDSFILCNKIMTIYIYTMMFGHLSMDQLKTINSELLCISTFIILFLSYADILTYLSYRYVFSRITWKGARITLGGSCFIYAGKRLLYRFLNILSFGFLMHRFDVASYDYVTKHTQYGGIPFVFHKAPIGSLRLTNIITGLLSFFTFGLSYLWYWAALRRHTLNNTTIGNLQLKVTDTGGGFLMIILKDLMTVLLACIVFWVIMTLNHSSISSLLAAVSIFVLYLLAIAFTVANVIQRRVVYRAKHTFVLGDLDAFQKIQAEAEESGNVVPQKQSFFDTDYGVVPLTMII